MKKQYYFFRKKKKKIQKNQMCYPTMKTECLECIGKMHVSLLSCASPVHSMFILFLSKHTMDSRFTHQNQKESNRCRKRLLQFIQCVGILHKNVTHNFCYVCENWSEIFITNDSFLNI